MMSSPAFTPRQVEILHLSAKGARQNEIAERLGVTKSTARAHLNIIYLRVGVSGYGAGERLTEWAKDHGYGGAE